MHKIILFTTVLILFSKLSFAAPYKCDRLGIFDDKNVCDVFCSRQCIELTPKKTGRACDTDKYRNFAFVNDKTYALTKSTVTWAGENTADIRDEADNKIIASILKSAGVGEAWIGIYDPSQSSTSYGVTEPGRFKTRSGNDPGYTAWKEGQPDNALNQGSIGNSPLYGEYWAIIDLNGQWNDIGLTENGEDRLRYAAVEWNGELSCVAGREESDSMGRPAGMVCGEEDPESGFKFSLCEEGGLFGGGSGWLCPQKKTLCEEDKKEIIKNEQFSADLTFPRPLEYRVKYPKPENTPMETNFSFRCSGENIGVYTSSLGVYSSPGYKAEIQNKNGAATLIITGYQSVFPAISECSGSGSLNYPPYLKTYPLISGKEIANSTLTFKGEGKSYAVKEGETVKPEIPSHGEMGIYITDMRYSAVIRNKHTEIKYTCPHSGRPCIENAGSYYCSPLVCSDGNGGGNYETNPGETPEGSGDADNNGERDENGNCLGLVKIFPGRDARCRMPGTQSKFHQCCKTLSQEDAGKPDIVIFPDVLDFDICYGSERQLAVNKGNDMCVNIGKYCAERWQGSGCVQYKETYCCFDSDFARAFSEAGMEMLGRSWGTPESPLCGGFSTEEMQYLTGAGITNHPKLKEFGDKLGKELGDKLSKEFEKNFDKNALGDKIENQIEGLEK